MADNQDKLSQSDQEKLDALEKQLSQKATDDPKTKASPDDKKAAPPFSSRETFTSDSAPAPTKTKTGFLWFFTLINLLLIGALIAAGYWAWLQWQNQIIQQQNLQNQQRDFMTSQQQEFASQQTELANAIAANKLVKDDFATQNQALQSTLEGLQTGIKQNAEQVSINENKLAEIAGRRPADWLLAEADYLVKIAGRKVWLEHDIETAVLMLQAADSRLEDLADPSLLPIRQFIAEDIQTLQQINPVSFTSIALNLKGLSEQVAALPLAFFKKPESPETESALTDNIDDWKSNLARSWDKFTERFFTIKKIAAEVKPFMSEQQQWLAKEQLKFTLLSAQVAIQQDNSALFKSELEAAQQQLNEYFVLEDSRVKQFSQSIRSLQDTDLKRTYPQQLSTLNPLQDLLQRRVDNRFNNGDH